MKAGQQRVQPEPQAEDPFGLSAWATSQREADVQTMTGRDLLLGTVFHLSSGGDGAERAGRAFTTWGRVATGGFEADVSDTGEDRVATDGDMTTGMVGLDAEWDRALAGIMFSHSVDDRDTRDGGESSIEAAGDREDGSENPPTFGGGEQGEIRAAGRELDAVEDERLGRRAMGGRPKTRCQRRLRRRGERVWIRARMVENRGRNSACRPSCSTEIGG